MLQNLLWYPLQVLFRICFRQASKSVSARIPASKPVIYIAPPVLSFRDALGLAFATGQPLFFLVQARMMRYTLGRLLMQSLQTFPLYCRADGKKALQKNLHTFDRCREVLMHNRSLVVFCASTDNGSQTKKAAARIAFSTEEVFDFKLDIQVVPLCHAFHYSGLFRAAYCLSLGTPISIKAFEDQYKNHPAKAIKQLTDHINQVMGMLAEEYLSEHGSLQGVSQKPAMHLARTMSSVPQEQDIPAL